MAKKLVFTKNAEEDLAEAHQWYENRQIGLGSELIKCVDAKLSSIAQSPLQYQTIIDKKIRRALTNHFPYSIYFIDEENRVIIIAILHQRQRQRYSDYFSNEIITPN